MNSLPIVQRELRVVSRRPWLYWIRPIFGGLGAIAALLVFLEEPSRAPGEAMLSVLSVMTLALALFSGCILTADCISSEKRDDTLGLLFLTNLRGYDVVMGKISSHAITTAAGLLALFPVFFLPLLAGGATWGETLRVLLGIAVSFLFALTLGVWVSARSWDARDAVLGTLAVIFLVVFLPLLLTTPHQASMVGILSPGMLLYYARDFYYVGPKAIAVYWGSIGLFLAASAVFAILASRRVPMAWRHSELKPGLETRPGSVRQPGHARNSTRAARRPFCFTSPNPVRELFLRRFGEFSWDEVFGGFVTLCFVAMLMFSIAEDDAFAFAILSIYGMHAVAKFVFAFDATRILNEDKRSSALELLLITPLGEHALADAQSAAFKTRHRRHLRRLVLLTLLLQLTAIVNPQLRIRGDDHLLVSSFLWGPMIWTWSDYHTVPWLALRHALRQNTHLKATLRTLGEGLLPWLPYFVVLLMMDESHVDETTAAVVTMFWAAGAATFHGMKTTVRRARSVRDLRIFAARP